MRIKTKLYKNYTKIKIGFLMKGIDVIFFPSKKILYILYLKVFI